MRWLQVSLPGAGLWQVTEDVLVAYVDEMGTATGAMAKLGRGKPLRAPSIARRLSSLKSLYGYAVRRRVLPFSPAEYVDPPKVPRRGSTPALPRVIAAKLLQGAHAIADDYPADAAAVALLVNTALRAGELEGLLVGRVRRNAGHTVLWFRLKGGDELEVPLAADVRSLVDPLTTGRPPADLHLYVLAGDGGSCAPYWVDSRSISATRCASN